jgi:hypothetical protein
MRQEVISLAMMTNIGAERETLQEHAVRGVYHKVAVGCWFTASDRAIPQMIKYETEDGEIRTLHNIQIVRTERKHYAGILSQKYVCRANVEGRIWEFILLYHMESNHWDLIIQDF